MRSRFLAQICSYALTFLWKQVHGVYFPATALASNIKWTYGYSRSYLSLSQHIFEACGQSLPEPMDIPGLSSRTKNSRLKTSYTYITLFPLFVYKWYVVVTYQPHAHICNSWERCVVASYRSIIFTPCEKHISYTCNSGELIQIGTEQLRNKRIFIYFPYRLFIIILGTKYINNSVNFYINPHFELTSAVI